MHAGLLAGAWLSFGGPDLPPDQRGEAGHWLEWRSKPLAGMLTLTGAPSLALQVAASQPAALVAVRLCAVDPVSGAALLLARGCLNLAQLRVGGLVVRGCSPPPPPLSAPMRCCAWGYFWVCGC
jgi:predicted acyl esterase